MGKPRTVGLESAVGWTEIGGSFGFYYNGDYNIKIEVVGVGYSNVVPFSITTKSDPPSGGPPQAINPTPSTNKKNISRNLNSLAWELDE